MIVCGISCNDGGTREGQGKTIYNVSDTDDATRDGGIATVCGLSGTDGATRAGKGATVSGVSDTDSAAREDGVATV